jgi:hypothetical protein
MLHRRLMISAFHSEADSLPFHAEGGGSAGPDSTRAARRPPHATQVSLVRWPDSGIAFPYDKTTAGPGARRGSGQETQRAGRQGHPHHGCGAWLHHRGEVRDAQLPLSRRAGWCLALRIAHQIQRLESDPRAFPNPKARWGPKNRRELSPRAPALQQDRLFGNLWAATREGSRENKKSSRGCRGASTSGLAAYIRALA